MNHLLIFCLLFLHASARRLSKNVLPIEYHLRLKLDLHPTIPLEKKSFDGNVSIKLNIREPTDRIILHSKNISTFQEDCYIIQDERKISVMEIKNDLDNEQVAFIFNETLGVSKNITLNIGFIGKLGENDTNGLFLTHYEDKNSIKRFLIASFAYSEAHRILPCFNEPWMKAIWNIEVTHPVGFTALSNSIEKQTIHANIHNYKTTIFHPTPIMSSYLLAITISDYGYTSDYSESGTLVRVFAPNHLLSATENALEVAVDSLNRFEIIFGINYSLPKLDLFPIDRFSNESAAMENWGLVIFKNKFLLGNRNIKRIVIHEIAHQWFGNLVTMEWLSELWLNEGFATFYESYEPNELDLYLEEIYMNYHRRGEIDETPSKDLRVGATYRINPYLSYFKSTAIVRMLWKVVGSWKFRRQVSKYLKNNAYKSTNSTILFSYLADSMPLGSPSISDFMNPWLEQVGHPAIVFRTINGTHYEMNQKRFDNGNFNVLDQKLPTPKWNYTWYIPIWYLEKGQKKEKLTWLKPGELMYINKTTTLKDGLWSREYVE